MTRFTHDHSCGLVHLFRLHRYRSWFNSLVSLMSLFANRKWRLQLSWLRLIWAHFYRRSLPNKINKQKTPPALDRNQRGPGDRRGRRNRGREGCNPKIVCVPNTQQTWHSAKYTPNVKILPNIEGSEVATTKYFLRRQEATSRTPRFFFALEYPKHVFSDILATSITNTITNTLQGELTKLPRCRPYLLPPDPPSPLQLQDKFTTRDKRKSSPPDINTTVRSTLAVTRSITSNH